MILETGTALLYVTMDIDPELEAEFNQWYDEEHIPERLSIPGFISARKYTALEGSPKYMVIYELETAAVLQSAEYLQYHGGPKRTDWSKKIAGQFQNFVRNVYVEMRPRPEKYK